MATSKIFSNTVKPVKPVETLELRIGRLNAIGLSARDAVAQEVRQYVKKTWGWLAAADPKVPGSEESWRLDSRQDRIERDGVWTWLLQKGGLVLWADYDQSWTCEQLLELVEQSPEAFEQALLAVYELNPELRPAGWVAPNQTDDQEDAKKKG